MPSLSRALTASTAGLTALIALSVAPSSALAASAPPAGGAAIGQVILATAFGLLGCAAMAFLVMGHRSGKVPLFSRLAAVAERVTGMKGWAALPGTVLIGALLVAVFGMYWDISIHIDKGRDPGPLANPAHYFILVGLFGVLFAGVMAIALPLRSAGRAEVQLARSWHAPVGALVIAACGAFSLTAFPLDDIWHRIFGQDVTLWGPTHLMLIGGAGLSVLGAWVLQVEGLGGRLTRDDKGLPAWTRRREVILAGAFLVGMSTFQAEFDFAVPQFRLIFHPVLEMFAAGLVLVAARIRLGRGGALMTVLSFLGVRLFVTLMVGGLIGNTTPRFPLYIGAALAVEAIGARFATKGRPLAFGALAGVGIATVGLACEWAWTHAVYVNPWPAAMMPEAFGLGLIMAVAAGTLGGWLGRTLTPAIARPASPGWPIALAAVAVVAVIGFSLPMPSPSQPIRATIATRDVQPAPHRAIAATVKLDPPTAADNAEWLNVTSWQGGGSVVDRLRRTGPGTYETTQAIPVSGTWKTTLRLQRGRAVLGLPIFLPRDPAIPVGETPAPAQFTRTFIRDKKNLQREQKQGVAGWLTGAAYIAVLLIALSLVALVTWALRRLERSYLPGTEGADPQATGRFAREAPAPVTEPIR